MNLKAIFTAKNLANLVLVLIVALILIGAAIHFEADLKIILIAASGAFLVIVARFGWLVLQKGWGWGLAKLHGWWNAGKADFSSLQGGLSALEGRVTAIEQKVLPVLQRTITQSAPIAPPSVAPPAAPAVQQSPNSNG